MSMPDTSPRPVGEPRLDVHNANVDEDSAAADECGTTNLANGSICRQAALHHGGCTFEAPAK
jgi:hypothetical protein